MTPITAVFGDSLVYCSLLRVSAHVLLSLLEDGENKIFALVGFNLLSSYCSGNYNCWTMLPWFMSVKTKRVLTLF